MELTQSLLHQLVSYDKDTGIFTWLGKHSKKATFGKTAGSVNEKGYLVIGIFGRTYKAHRLAIFYVTGSWPERQVDHIDGNKRNNAYANLRQANNILNSENKRSPYKNNRSGLLGVSPSKRGWVAQIQVGGKKKPLGVFSDLLDAHKAYLSAKRSQHKGCTI